MNTPARPENAVHVLDKIDYLNPALLVTGPMAIAILAGTTFAGKAFDELTPVPIPGEGLSVGRDYVVTIDPSDGRPHISVGASIADCSTERVLGGFHYAPGGNAVGRKGGDSNPAINPSSVWDVRFRPKAPDPRGMFLVDAPRGRCFLDIYLLCADHVRLGCTSVHGVTIADGNDPPEKPEGGKYDGLDHDTAVKVLAHHGKTLMSYEEFVAGGYGVTEKTAAGRDPKITGLDAARTSAGGGMQFTGNLWVWGHDGDPDDPRPSLFGGSWVSAGVAGSRQAYLGSWPAYSSGNCGARGRCDLLILE